MENWDTSLVTDMGSAFNSEWTFNGDISGWDTSAVPSMFSIFSGASAFNQDISQWLTSKVTDMSFMFSGATAFNQDISRWATSNVTLMNAMFQRAAAFDQEIRGWDVSKVTDFNNMFTGATAFAAKYSTVPAFAVTPTAAFFTPPASSDATLSALALSQGSLSPSFASGTLAYTASVVHSVNSLIVTPTTNDANATAAVNGASAATPVTLAVGSNTVTVQVTAQDGTTTQSYTVTVTRAAALTVALTGPSSTVTGPFTVTATLSSPVVSFVASDVTVVNGQVTGVTGSGTSYAIAVTPVLGQQVSVSVAAGVVSTALGTSNQLSNILQVQAGSPATALAAHEDELAAVIRGEAGRELRAGLAADQRMVRAGFQRIMARRQSNAQGVNGFVPFDITGTARYRNGSFRTNGDFFALSTVGGKQWHRVAFGDFDFLSDSLGNSSGYLTARLAYETQFSQDVMLGYYIGADIGKAKVGGTFNGTQNSVGLSFGGYFNRIYNDKLIVSGFASLGQRQHDFDASNTTLAVSSDYRTAIGRVGGSVTGSIERGNITIAPELAFNVARTNVHSIPISGTAYGLTNNNLSLDVGGVDLASISFTPHVKLRVADHAMPGYRSSFSIGPKISCEAVRAPSLSKDCGTGGVLGMTMISNDGATVFQAELEQEGIGGTKRRSVKLSFQHQF